MEAVSVIFENKNENKMKISLQRGGLFVQEVAAITAAAAQQNIMCCDVTTRDYLSTKIILIYTYRFAQMLRSFKNILDSCNEF